MEKHAQTNVLVVQVLHRFDLEAHSCVNENQEQKVENLPTKRTSRLPTTRHTDFFMAGHQHEATTVRNTETSCAVSHHNIKGLVNKPERFSMVNNLGFSNDGKTMNNILGTNLHQVKKVLFISKSSIKILED